MKQIHPSPTKQSSPDEILSQFEQWRCNRPSTRQPIPDQLWKAAASLYPALSIHRISRTLRLDYNKLKHHVTSLQNSSQLKMSDSVFIDLGICDSVTPYEYSVEMQHHDGARMKIEIKNGSGSDIINLAQLFWSRP